MDASENISEVVNILNTATGKTGQIRRTLFNNDFFNPIVDTKTGARNLVEVKDGTKPFIPETYKPSDSVKFAEVHPDKVADVKPVTNEK